MTTKRVLVADDDPSTQRLIRSFVEREGFECIVAASGTECLNKIDAVQPHLLVLDYRMDDLNGLEVLKKLREQLNYVAVIFVAGQNDESLIVNCLDAGADDFVLKPFLPRELASRIRARLRTVDLHLQLSEANQSLLQMSKHDPLTGLYNMQWAYDKLEHEINRAARYAYPLSVVMLDIDHFKRVNDCNDHLFGSHVLKLVGELIRDSIRRSDFAARYGGDEFMIVLADSGVEGALSFLERFRKKFAAMEFTDGRYTIELTASIGFSSLEPGNLIDAKTFVQQADQALYASKRNGRNQVTAFAHLKQAS